MLKKLLKYDLINIFRFLIIFYILSLFFGILTRIFFSIDNSFIMNIIAKICSGVTISMIFNILINNIMRLWVRFRNNLYGDESYLTHTLPIEKKTLYLSKIIVASLSLFISVFVIGVSMFIAYYSKENLQLLKNILLPIVDAYDSTIMQILFSFFFIFFLEFLNILQAGYSGIILGHKRDNGKIGFSIIFGFLIYMLTQIFALIIIFLIALFNKDMMNLFITNTLINISMVKVIIYVSSFVYTVSIFIVYFVNVKLFSDGVNVE